MNLKKLKDTISDTNKSDFIAMPFSKSELMHLLSNYEKAVETLKLYGNVYRTLKPDEKPCVAEQTLIELGEI